LAKSDTAETHTATGPVEVSLYAVSLTIFRPDEPADSYLFRPFWKVMGLPHDLPTIDVLIGMDLIREIVLTINGPAGSFALTF